MECAAKMKAYINKRFAVELNDEELCREGPPLRELPNPENNDPPDELEDERLWELGPNELLLPKELELLLLRKLLDELRLLRKLPDELRLLLELLLRLLGGIFTSFSENLRQPSEPSKRPIKRHTYSLYSKMRIFSEKCANFAFALWSVTKSILR